ncbi:class I SAM-dependent methyltransferase [Halomarina ordinaria]|uniref:Class I SAM-dependent methyltransferase n=1 Tax=Halomarina ordinaria TaxID=3033939 RepID=A0ABD5UDL8_9EURY|nr:class I SAM-dependent methyltransferase [Halomarina sp. PSRA2]
MRDEVLTRWVNQPPADPVYQYLRDAEKESAWEVLGARERVLDIASEANVTRGLDAAYVARVDFSSTAIDYAREVLGDEVDRYEWVDPETPRLPFPDDHFDGGVSIGPYDWKFLDVTALTAEVRRVTRGDGLFVFSVPTPRSPYHTGGRFSLRYYTPGAARSLLAPGWELADYDLVYQHPYWLHSKLAMAPPALQRPFVTAAKRLDDRLDARDDWDDASYLVLGARPLDYERHVERALDCLYRPTDENGFWDAEGGHIVRALEYDVADGTIAGWTPTDDVVWRYAPFALMGSLRWRCSSLGDGSRDAKIERELAYFRERVADPDTLREMPSYGIGALTYAFARAATVYGTEYATVARDLYEHADERFDFDDSEDSLLLYGWTYLYEVDPGADLRRSIDGALYELVERQNAWKTLFYFDNPTTRRHQNQMYTLWALSRAVEVTGCTGYLENVEAVLDYTIEERMRDDGAFIWEDPSRRTYAGAELRRRLGTGFSRPPHWEFLYPCHQTFFVVAVAHYYAAGGERDYDDALGEAMRWIYGRNDLGADLTEVSGLGVPVRFLTTDGRLDVADQQFKGAYEVGAYVMALTDLVEHERARARGGTPRVGRRRAPDATDRSP